MFALKVIAFLAVVIFVWLPSVQGSYPYKEGEKQTDMYKQTIMQTATSRRGSASLN